MLAILELFKFIFNVSTGGLRFHMHWVKSFNLKLQTRTSILFMCLDLDYLVTFLRYQPHLFILSRKTDSNLKFAVHDAKLLMEQIIN